MNNLEVDNLANKQLWDSLYNRFDSEICKKCDKQISSKKNIDRKTSPEPIPYIGPKFYNSKYRLLFVGKGTFGGERRKSGGYDVFPTHEIKNYYMIGKEGPEKKGPGSAFWRWIRNISMAVHDVDKAEQAFPNIAYTNLHKCQAVPDGRDKYDWRYYLDDDMSENCITKAKWIFHEIEEIKPKNVILFLNNDLAELFLKNKNLIKMFNYEPYIKKESNKKRIQKMEGRIGKDLFTHVLSNDIRYIITRHPQGALNEIREEIIRIIKDDDQRGAQLWEIPYKF